MCAASLAQALRLVAGAAARKRAAAGRCGASV